MAGTPEWVLLHDAAVLPRRALALLGLLGTALPFGAHAKRAVVPPPIPCPVFPADNVWNRDVSTLPVHPQSAAHVATLGANTTLHMDFGSGKYAGETIGISYTVVPARQRLARMRFTDYADESDPGPYPIPRNAPIEGGPKSRGDRHVLVVQDGTCKLYELYLARGPKGRSHTWRAASGAVWDLRSNATRPAGYTSADAAGLPILAGLVRFDEVASGEIRHALRFTTKRTQNTYVWPARHRASEVADPNVPPMGIRVRLKADYDVSGFSPAMQVLLTAMKRYGMILADNGSNWYVSGTSDPRWNNDELHTLDVLTGADFEVIDESSLIIDPDSAQSR